MKKSTGKQTSLIAAGEFGKKRAKGPGLLRPVEKKATIYDLARIANVSPAR